MGQLNLQDNEPLRVRFSHELDNREVSSATAKSKIPALSLNTSTSRPNTSGETKKPVGILVKKGTSPTSSYRLPQNVSHTRKRGYSLRRSLLNRNISNLLSKDLPKFRDENNLFRKNDSGNLTPIENDFGKKDNQKINVEYLSQELDYRASSTGSSGCDSSDNSTLSPMGKGRHQPFFFATSLSCCRTLARTAFNDSSVLHKLNTYRNVVFNKFFGSVQIPPSKNGRCIELDATRKLVLIDERTGKEYVGNAIRSSRYTLWNFIPRQLFFQFSKLANAYFLLVSILQVIPGLSTTGTYTTIAPLMVFVAISMSKEGYDDIRRYKLDKVENSREALVFNSSSSFKDNPTDNGLDDSSRFQPRHDQNSSSIGGNSMQPIITSNNSLCWKTVKWQDIKVGDIVKLRRNDHVPADIVLLHVEEPNGIAYIETMALDGETNLKSKQAPTYLSKNFNTIDDIVKCHAKVVVEDPNIDLYNFNGSITIGDETLPLTTNEIVLRGSTLRNTPKAIGMVINTGEECKIRMNANKNPRIKAPELQKITNRIVIILVFFVFSLTLLCTVAYQIWSVTTEKRAFYLQGIHINIARIFIGFFILYNTLIPLSLYVSLEVIKTTTILENLGQVNYIFSDKTGTLTENVMRFRKLSVAGYAWLHDLDLQKEATFMKQNHGDEENFGKTKDKSQMGKMIGLRSQNRKPSDITTSTSTTTNSVRRSGSIWRSTAQPFKKLNSPEYRTEELLKFFKCKPHSVFTKKARFFLLSLALCHTCLPEVQENGEIGFQAASPDELALVQAAQDLGWLVIERAAKSITLVYPADSDCSRQVTETYEILDVIEFSSKRKRMSIIVRFPNRNICIFCKGADTIVLPKLKNSSLAMEKKSDVFRRSSQRKSMEAEHALRKISEHSPATSFHRTSICRKSLSLSRRRSTGQTRCSSIINTGFQPIRDELDSWLRLREQSSMEALSDSKSNSAYTSPRSSSIRDSSAYSDQALIEDKNFDNLIDEILAVDEAAVLERCFQHIEDFASEGLRTLLFGYRFIDEEEYTSWKKIYAEATISLVNRQELIEKAGDIIEYDFNLSGATAIEDKLQKGVPETIDKLRRANIKIWMLTGDKRETAINIAYSARLCKSYSEVVILDHAKGDIDKTMTTTLVNLRNGTAAHTVIVVDGQTLSEIDLNDVLAQQFFDLVVLADSVICCRASPSQKSSLVRRVRMKVAKSTTLAIGDGANDISMILEAHVGIGISGKEGLQAARISDYSIAQFRFLQKLLLVHGRWNYIRTGKYILATFWKELVFYLLQALYQKWAGFTGTSLFESTSLTVFNTFFTSLSVLIIGIFEQDLSATTLLAVPELYIQGQRDEGFNIRKYIAWMIMAISESMIIFFTMFGLFGTTIFSQDSNVLSMGTLCFTVSLIFINTKLLILEMHNKTFLSLGSWTITVFGWFLWQILLSGVFKPGNIYPLYPIKNSFLHYFGADLLWWVVVVLGISCLIILELGVSSIRKTFWPTDVDVFQELQCDSLIRKRFEDTLKAELHGDIINVEMGRESRSMDLRSEGEVQTLIDRSSVTKHEVIDKARRYRRSKADNVPVIDDFINTRSVSKGKSVTNSIEMSGRGTLMRHSIDVAELMRKT